MAFKFRKEALIFGPATLMLCTYIFVGSITTLFFGKEKKHEWKAAHQSNINTADPKMIRLAKRMGVPVDSLLEHEEAQPPSLYR